MSATESLAIATRHAQVGQGCEHFGQAAGSECDRRFVELPGLDGNHAEGLVPHRGHHDEVHGFVERRGVDEAVIHDLELGMRFDQPGENVVDIPAGDMDFNRTP